MKQESSVTVSFNGGQPMPLAGFEQIVQDQITSVEEIKPGELGTVSRSLLTTIKEIDEDTTRREFDARLEQTELVLQLEARNDVMVFKGGLPKAVHQVLGWKASKISKQRLVAEYLVKPLSLEGIKNFEFTDFSKLYYAARALKKCITFPPSRHDGSLKPRAYTPLEALQAVESMTRNEASAWSRDEIDRKLSTPLVTLPWKIDQTVAEALERGVNRFIDVTGFGRSADAPSSLTQALEVLAEYLENGHEEKLRTLERESTDGTAMLEPANVVQIAKLERSNISDETIEAAWNAGRTQEEIKNAFKVGSTRVGRIRKSMVTRGWSNPGDWNTEETTVLA